MKKVLILTAGFGEGHNAAARNLADALEFISEDVQTEILDLLDATYGKANLMVKKTYLGILNYMPGLWNNLYHWMDQSRFLDRQFGNLTRLQHALRDILQETQPDCVVSTYPLYGHIIQRLFRDHRERSFRFITIVTDSISVHAAWYRAPSDFFCVANEATAEVLRSAGLSPERIKPLGFPVSPAFTQALPESLLEPGEGLPKRLLYIINSAKKKAAKTVEHLLAIPGIHLTITTGRDPELKADLMKLTQFHADRVSILGWTNLMPRLMRTSHLVISKAGGATVQEAIAARCPLIINHVLPGQEAGNAELVEKEGLGAVTDSPRGVARLVERAFEQNAQLWREWRSHLSRLSRPDAALRLAELVLEQCEWREGHGRISTLFAPPGERVKRHGQSSAPSDSSSSSLLLCDFHIHSNYSDGKLSVPELVDMYGTHGFDCICITDHLSDPSRLIGKLVKLSNLTLSTDQLDEYFEVMEQERARAWRKYRMLLLTGFEFNKDGYTSKSSAHLLGLDIKSPIDPRLDLEEIIHEIHAQDGLAVASHPHKARSVWGKNTLYLWEQQDRFAPLLDAWEIANRDDIFNPIGLKRLPFLANSDLHKPKHIYSWKTILFCPKDPEAIKRCIKSNQNVAITLYRPVQKEARGLRRACFQKPVSPLDLWHEEQPWLNVAAS